MNCHNCGLPDGSLTTEGINFPLETRTTQTRKTTRTVLCCSEECGIQALAVNLYGAASSKWPISLAEFRELHGKPYFAGRTVTKAPTDTRINSGADEPLNQKVTLPYPETVLSGFRHENGRPRKHDSDAAKMRAYRARKAACYEHAPNL